jgi:hypothetical protein
MISPCGPVRKAHGEKTDLYLVLVFGNWYLAETNYIGAGKAASLFQIKPNTKY